MYFTTGPANTKRKQTSKSAQCFSFSMRYFSLLFLLLLCFPVLAQTPDTFTCDNDLSYKSQITIIPPELDEALNQITVTAMSINKFTPVVGVTASDGVTFCNEPSSDAELYEAQLPSMDVPASPLNAQQYVVDAGKNSIQIGEFNANTGATLVVLEGYIVDSNQQYTLQMTDEMLATGQEPHAYLFALTGDYNPSLTVNSGDTSLSAEPVEAQLTTSYDTSSSAVMSALPMEAGDIQLTVETGGEGFYALVLELQTGQSLPGDADAQVTVSDDGTITLSCDAQIASENAVSLVLPDNHNYTATAIATEDIDPVLAPVDNNGEGRCFDNTAGAETYAVELPTIQASASSASAQTTVSPDSKLIVGSNESLAGDYVLVIEGGSIEDGESDLFKIQVTPQMTNASEFLTAYVLAADDMIDPVLTWEKSADELITCDNSGIDDTCQEGLPSLQGTNLFLANSDRLIGSNLDPMLQIPIDTGMEGTTIPLQVSAVEGTSGNYVLVLHIITD